MTAAVALQAAIARERSPFLLLGVHDMVSATLAARLPGALFVSGAGLTASLLGLPDVGFLNAPHVVRFVRQVTTVLGPQLIVVDLDDGFGGPETSARVVGQLAMLGAAGVIVEDQARPRRFGHLGGASVVPLHRQLAKLAAIRTAAPHLLVIARTDAAEPVEVLRRVAAFVEAGIDAVLVAGISDVNLIKRVRGVRGLRYLVFDRVARPDRRQLSMAELRLLGVDICLSSTASISAAFDSIQTTFRSLHAEWQQAPQAPPVAAPGSWLSLMADNLAENHHRIGAPPTYESEP